MALNTTVKLNPQASTLDKRVGCFRLSFEVLDTSKDELLEVMSNFLVVSAVACYATRSIVYIAYSTLFEVTPPNVAPSEYKLIIHTNLNSRTTVTAQKIT